ncbi:hypothetical protein E4U30_002429 [Claviceps sp. LM220 group G6]|nr:hypothetical protein E4U30_002429 [Claviceps sp. LM220 group G6]
MRFLSILALAALTAAHMEMKYPAPFLSKYNVHSTQIDYSMTSPLFASGANFPCKGYHSVLNTPQGRSVANWKTGQPYTVTLEGSATHDGGSCQLSLSYDKGQTWKVIQSFIGGCPLTPNWPFVVPADAPTGEALFAWSWFNRIGNREMYMNCAHVTIESSKPPTGGASFPWSKRPNVFVANVNNGCRTLEMADVVFPEPGPDVKKGSDKLADPVGNCKPQ